MHAMMLSAAGKAEEVKVEVLEDVLVNMEERINVLKERIIE